MTIPNRFQTEKSGRKWKAVSNIVWIVLVHDPASDKSVFNAFLGDFFSSKASIPWILRGFWPLLATSDHFWPLLTTSDHFWPLLTTSGHFVWRINISGRHFKRSKKRRSIGGNTTARRGREITPPINQSIEGDYCVMQWTNQKQWIWLNK